VGVSRTPSTPPALLRRRLTAQGLAGPVVGAGAVGPLAVARRLLAIQGQDPRGARLAIRARTRDTTGTDVDRALTEDRSLVLTWLNRGTLHLVTREDYPLLQALIAPRLRAGADYALARHGIDADGAARAVRIVDRALADDGPQSRHALRERLQSAGVPAHGQGLVYVLYRASTDGVLVRGPVGGDGEHLYARVADWLPEAAAEVARISVAPERGYAEIARRFLVGHGPADAGDLAKWLSLPLGEVRSALSAIGDELRELGDGTVELTRVAGGIERVGRLPPPRLLGVFEPLLMGWRSRSLVLGDRENDVVTGGIFRGLVLVDGRAAGSWKFAGRGIALTPFGELPSDVTDVLSADGEALLRFLGRA
jgi:Winged helix DNA-binding domain